MLFATRLGQSAQQTAGFGQSAQQDIAAGALVATAAYVACAKTVGPAAALACAAGAWLASPMHGELKLKGVNLCQFPHALEPGEYLRDNGLCLKIGEYETCEMFRLRMLAFYSKERKRFRDAGQVYPPDTVNINPIGIAACREHTKRVPKGTTPGKLYIYGPTIVERNAVAGAVPPPGSSVFVAQLSPQALEQFAFQRTPPPADAIAVFDSDTNQYRILVPVIK